MSSRFAARSPDSARFYTIEQALRFMELIEGGVLVSTGVGWTERRWGEGAIRHLARVGWPGGAIREVRMNGVEG